MKAVDIAIIGAGGAGLTAALYAARARRSTVVFERKVTGGQIATTDVVENYPGFPDGINGFDLSQLFVQQAEKFGAEMVYEDVTSIERQDDGTFRLSTESGEYRAKAVVVTAGADYNKLGIPGEDDFIGRGVSWCATCDAAFFRDEEVAVVGGGDAAMDEGLFVTRHAKKVYVIHRREELRASQILQDRAFANPKMEFIWNTVVDRVNGDDKGSVTSLDLRNVVTGETSKLDVGAIFIFIGQTPNSHLLKGLVEMDEGGHALVDLNMATSLPGLYVAGDLRSRAARQLVAACGDGATAAIAAERYIETNFAGTPELAEAVAEA